MKSKLDDYDFYEISQAEARMLGPFGDDDGPVDVRCYRQVSRWESRKAAERFFEAGSMCCGGSEQGRYLEILADLREGLPLADDKCP